MGAAATAWRGAMNTMRLKRLAAALLAVLAAPAGAVQLDYTLELGLLHSDNINLSQDDPVSQNVAIPAINFTLSQEGATVQALVRGVAEYRNYLGNAFDDEFRGQLDGIVNWTLLPERLTWTFQDALGLQPINVLQADTPTNLQQTNVFATGPTFRFRLNPVLRGQAELRYVDSYAEETAEFNSRRLLGALRLFHDLSSTSEISGNLQTERVDFDEDGIERYTRYDLFARYTSHLAVLDLDTVLGYSRFDYRDRDDRSGLLARATLGWRPSARSTFNVTLMRQYSDAATDMMADPAAIGTGGTGIVIGDVSIDSGVYLEERVDVGYAYTGERLGLHVVPYWRKLDYEQESRGVDQRGSGINGEISYRFRPQLRGGFVLAAERRDFIGMDRRDDDSRYGLFLTQQWTRHWAWRLDLLRGKRDSTGDGADFDDSQAYLRVSYTR